MTPVRGVVPIDTIDTTPRWHSIVSNVGFVLLTIGVVVVLRAWGPSVAVVYTGSMVPTYNPGDMVVIAHHLQPGVGDIASFVTPIAPGDPTLLPVTHRIIGQDQDGYITKGDATPEDWWRIQRDQINGQVVASFPMIWLFRAAALLIGIAVLLFLWPSNDDPEEGTSEWWRQRMRSGEPWLRSARVDWAAERTGSDRR